MMTMPHKSLSQSWFKNEKNKMDNFFFFDKMTSVRCDLILQETKLELFPKDVFFEEPKFMFTKKKKRFWFSYVESR
jgi:hypothetical protein